jgi:hypothetical protein
MKKPSRLCGAFWPKAIVWQGSHRKRLWNLRRTRLFLRGSTCEEG